MAYRIYEGLNVIFEMKGPFAKLLTQERKAIIKASLWDGGEWFRTERLPLRFTDLAYRLGYRVTNDWKAFKRRVNKTGRALPFIGTTPPGGGTIKSIAGGHHDGLDVHNAEKMAVAMQRGCRTDVTGTSQGGDIVIRTPYGHPIRPAYAEVMKGILPSEYQQIAQKVAASFNEFLAYARTRSKRSKKMTITGATDAWTPRTHGGSGIDTRHRGGGLVTDRK